MQNKYPMRQGSCQQTIAEAELSGGLNFLHGRFSSRDSLSLAIYSSKKNPQRLAVGERPPPSQSFTYFDACHWEAQPSNHDILTPLCRQSRCHCGQAGTCRTGHFQQILISIRSQSREGPSNCGLLHLGENEAQNEVQELSHHVSKGIARNRGMCALTTPALKLN